MVDHSTLPEGQGLRGEQCDVAAEALHTGELHCDVGVLAVATDCEGRVVLARVEATAAAGFWEELLVVVDVVAALEVAVDCGGEAVRADQFVVQLERGAGAFAVGGGGGCEE